MIQVRWYTGDGQLISKGSSLWQNLGSDQSLSNARAQLGNVGKHWCEATNIAGKAQKDFVVDVQGWFNFSTVSLIKKLFINTDNVN